MTIKFTEGVITCPYCDYGHDDCDNRVDSDMEGTMECHSCGEEFTYEADITVSWYTATRGL